MNPVILHGTIVHTPTKDVFDCHPDSYLISEDGKVTGIFQELPEKYKKVRNERYAFFVYFGRCT